MNVNTRTPKARALGRALRKAREDRELSLRSLALSLGRDPGQLSRWETGDRVPRPTEVAQILTHLGVTGQRYDETIEIADSMQEPVWLAVTLPEQRRQLNALIDFERNATHVTEASPLLVPGLLQTAEYARAIMIGAMVPADEIETRVAVRIGRRDTLTRPDPVQLTAFVGEAALRQRIGSDEITARQLEFLLDLAQLPNIELRALPLRTEWHPALEGPYLLLESDQGPMVHLENRRSGLFLHEPEDVQIYREATNALRGVALDAVASAECITDVLKEWRAT